MDGRVIYSIRFNTRLRLIDNDDELYKSSPIWQFFDCYDMVDKNGELRTYRRGDKRRIIKCRSEDCGQTELRKKFSIVNMIRHLEKKHPSLKVLSSCDSNGECIVKIDSVDEGWVMPKRTTSLRDRLAYVHPVMENWSLDGAVQTEVDKNSQTEAYPPRLELPMPSSAKIFCDTELCVRTKQILANMTTAIEEWVKELNKLNIALPPVQTVISALTGIPENKVISVTRQITPSVSDTLDSGNTSHSSQRTIRTEDVPPKVKDIWMKF